MANDTAAGSVLHYLETIVVGCRHVLLAVGVACSLPSAGVADLTLRTVIESSVDSAQAQVVTTTYIKGPWLRRESQGDGLLADLLGTPVEITNRQTGETFHVTSDLGRFTVDTSVDPTCGVAWAVDWRLLGRVRGGTRTHLEVPDSTRVIEGCEVSLLQIKVPAAHGGMTMLSIWICPDYRAVFGPQAASDLLCGDSTLELADRVGFAASRRRQFSLSEADGKRLADHMGGYPLLIESVSTHAASVSRTQIRLDGWSLDDLPDSLFRPPAGYDRGN